MDELALPSPSVSKNAHWLRFALNKRINAKLRRAFYHHYPDAKRLGQLLADPIPRVDTCDAPFNELASEALRHGYRSDIDKAIETALNWQQSKHNHHIVSLQHPHYPAALAATSDAPPLLYVSGQLQALNQPALAIVGARKATLSARELTHDMAAELASAGISIISGLAVGIDAAAHEGALAAGGKTVAVAATSPDRIYPARHQDLAERLLENGAIVSEFALGTPLRPGCFPRRNRLISGISCGVLVVEAALPSGSLTTAQHALSQGREVMAMPGSVRNPLTRGCHALIRDGAGLIESTADILQCLSHTITRQSNGTELPDQGKSGTINYTKDQAKLANSDPDALTLLDCLGFDPISIDTLVRRSGLNAPRVAAALTRLELSGDIVLEGGGRYTRCKHRNIG